MTRAHRLIGVWMAGALASVVVYRVHALRSTGGTVPPAATPSCAPPGAAPAADEPLDAITKYLQVRYDDVEYRDDGYTILGLAYIPGEERLIELDRPVLRRFLPDTRFFMTRLSSPYMEYQRVTTLVSFRRASGRDDIRSFVATDFGKPSRKFLSQFIGLSAPTPQARRDLALAIAELVARTVHMGSARLSAVTADARADFWRGQNRQRGFVVIGDPEGRVKRIFIMSATSPDVIDEVVSAF